MAQTDQTTKMISYKLDKSQRKTSSVALLQSDDFTFALFLLLFNTLNLTDFAFTVQAVTNGFREANPFMEMLFLEHNLVVAGLIKIFIGIVTSSLIWLFRKYPQVVAVALFACLIYTILFLYHIFSFATYLARI
jgi:hypothetical protein